MLSTDSRLLLNQTICLLRSIFTAQGGSHSLGVSGGGFSCPLLLRGGGLPS